MRIRRLVVAAALLAGLVMGRPDSAAADPGAGQVVGQFFTSGVCAVCPTAGETWGFTGGTTFTGYHVRNSTDPTTWPQVNAAFNGSGVFTGAVGGVLVGSGTVTTGGITFGVTLLWTRNGAYITGSGAPGTHRIEAALAMRSMDGDGLTQPAYNLFVNGPATIA